MGFIYQVIVILVVFNFFEIVFPGRLLNSFVKGIISIISLYLVISSIFGFFENLI